MYPGRVDFKEIMHLGAAGVGKEADVVFNDHASGVVRVPQLCRYLPACYLRVQYAVLSSWR